MCVARRVCWCEWRPDHVPMPYPYAYGYATRCDCECENVATSRESCAPSEVRFGFGWVRFAFAGLLAPKLLGQDDVVLRLKCVSMSALPTWGCTHTPAHSVPIQAQRGCEGALNGSCFPCPFSYFHLCLISPVCRPYWGRLTVRTLKAPFSSRAA